MGSSCSLPPQVQMNSFLPLKFQIDRKDKAHGRLVHILNRATVRVHPSQCHMIPYRLDMFQEIGFGYDIFGDV